MRRKEGSEAAFKVNDNRKLFPRAGAEQTAHRNATAVCEDWRRDSDGALLSTRKHTLDLFWNLSVQSQPVFCTSLGGATEKGAPATQRNVY